MSHATKPYGNSRERKSKEANTFQPPSAAQSQEDELCRQKRTSATKLAAT
jgi:hypothetical protein